MFGRKLINGSVKLLGVPAPVMTNGPPWTDNILVSSPDWVAGDTGTSPNWGSQPGGPYGSVSIQLSVLIRVMTAYVRRSPENMRSTASHVRDDLLQDNLTARL